MRKPEECSAVEFPTMASEPRDMFLRACEVVSLPELIIRPGGPRAGEGYRITMAGPFAVIGDDPSADLRVAGARLARRHCYLQAMGSKVLCVGLGTGVHDSRGHVTAGWIDEEHGVWAGDQRIALASEGPESETRQPVSLSTLSAPQSPSPSVPLEFRTGTRLGRWVMKSKFAMIGSAPGCTIRLDCPTVSPLHGFLILTDLGLWVVDLLGEVDSPYHERLRLNGTPVRFGELGPNDVLDVGRFRVNIQPRSSSSNRRSTPDRRRSGGQMKSHEGGISDSDSRVTADGTAVGEDVFAAQRQEFEAKLAALADRHRVEIERLEQELKSLRAGYRDEAAASKPVSSATTRPAKKPVVETAVRPLGSASRRDRMLADSGSLFDKEIAADKPSGRASYERAGTGRLGHATSPIPVGTFPPESSNEAVMEV